MIVDNKKPKKRKRGVLENLLLPHYKTYQKNFKEWLTRLGYAQGTIKSDSNKLRYFFSFLQSENVQTIYHIENHHIAAYNELLLVTP